MLIDPENPANEWAEEVWATSLEDAEKRCREMAGDNLTEVLNVTQQTRKPSKRGTYKFICWFKTEETP